MLPLALLAETPALPLHEAGKYVAGAYIVFLVMIVIYVAIMATRLQRLEKEMRELASFAEQRRETIADEQAQHAEVGGG